MASLRTLTSVFGLFILASSLAWFGLEKISVLGMMERWISDVRIATLTPSEPQHPDIVIVTITEETLQQFPYRSPIDRAFLANLLANLESKGVRAALLDVLLDQPTEQTKDDRLKQTLEQFTKPLAISYVASNQLLTSAQRHFLDAYVPKQHLGLANLEKDPFDDTVRHIFPGKRGESGVFIPGVTSLMASKLGKSPPRTPIEIAWRGKPDEAQGSSPFRTFPAHLVPVLPAPWFADKVILIGTDLSLRDRHRTPFSVVARNQEGLAQFGMPGIFVMAHSLAQLLDERASPTLSNGTKMALLGLAATLGTLLAWIPLSLTLRVGLILFSIPACWFGGFNLFQEGGPLIPLLLPTLGFLFAFIFSEIYRGFEERKKRNFLKQAFSRYLSPELVDLLIQDPDRLSRGAERRVLTFLFTDIEGFTTVSEKADPSDLAPQMNIYLDGVCSAVLDHGGMVVDLIGDAVFAMFNAPLQQDDHADRATRCAVEINRVTKVFLKTPEAIRLGFGRTRIGVHTGEALVGNFGAEDRFKYTPLGDAVNIGARIEGLNKYFGTQICASQKSIESSSLRYVRPIGDVILKGKEEPISIFEIMTDKEENPTYLKRYLEAFHSLEQGEKATARARFQALAIENPNDGCVALHLDRLNNNKGSTLIKMADK
ncbi:MAG: adenylate/guanylate cyclase domain-containing protein [Magnetococcales bacterium]|nr:adenylate/guanylate cyclase domain-containing protein [Magnetococcales bacterium]